MRPIARPLRVLHVIDSLGEAGAEQNLVTLLRYLPRSDYEHHVAWIYEDDSLLPAITPLVASTLPLGVRRSRDLPRAAIELARHLRRLRPDVLSAKLIQSQLLARLASRMVGGVPIVSTWECTSYAAEMYSELRWKGRYLRRLIWLLDAGSSRLDARFIAVSSEVAEKNARALGVHRDRVSVVYNAFDPAKITEIDPAVRAALRAELGASELGPLLLSVGRLAPQKDHATSIDAMHRVVQSAPNAVLAIAGGGPRATILTKKVEALGLREQVRILGPRTDIPALLRSADLLLSASRYEGHSVALMEALAAGLPCVLSRIPSFVEVLGANSPSARYFTPGDVGGLATTILGAFDDLPALKEAAQVQAARIRERFAPNVMAEQYDAIFHAAANHA